jgi:sugar lactone lactonase YvrE
MKAFSVGRFLLGPLFISLLVSTLWAQNAPPVSTQITFAGSYTADGRYISAAQMNRWHQVMIENASSGTRPAEVPTFVNLHPREESIENFQPPVHAQKVAKGQSAFANLRDNLITFVYGHEKLLVAPHQIAVDSHGRVIVCDPAADSVHVLDGAQSFRLLTGPNRRLIKPAGIAVDASDNIYISDSERGLVAVYDPSGRFLHYIGKLGDESLFHEPTALAVVGERLYVLDSERHALFIMGFDGRVVRRVGRYDHNDVHIDFEFPSAIVAGQQQLVILDAGGSRLNILDLDGNLQKQVQLAPVFRHGTFDDLGLALDSAGNFYVSNLVGGSIRVYDPSGNFIGALGTDAAQPAHFNAPTSIWIGGSKLYVSDLGNRRIDVFQMTVPSRSDMLAADQSSGKKPTTSSSTTSTTVALGY